MDCTGENILVCDSHNNRVQVFSKKGKFIECFGLKELGKYPYGISVFKEKILVTDTLENRIIIFDSGYKPISEIRLDDFLPRRICFLGQELLLVTMDKGFILRVDWKGNIIEKLGSDYGEPINLTNIGGICLNNKGEILVTDCRYGVRTLASDGKFISCFDVGSIKEYGVENVKTLPTSSGFHLLGSICVDQDDNIFVIDDTNSRICIFTPNGTLIQDIPLNGYYCDLFLSSRRMFVSRKDSICVFSNEK